MKKRLLSVIGKNVKNWEILSLELKNRELGGYNMNRFKCSGCGDELGAISYSVPIYETRTTERGYTVKTAVGYEQLCPTCFAKMGHNNV